MDFIILLKKKFPYLFNCFHFEVLLILFIYSSASLAEFSSHYNLAFYYGSHPPLAKLRLFKNVVIEPSSGLDPQLLEMGGRNVYAYASLGEAISLNQYEKPIDKSWVIAKNKNWQSLVLDQSNPAWQAFFINQIITPLWEKGYRGFFLDTLDSYRIASEDPQKMKKQQEGIITTIRAIKSKYPNARLIVNRGFEVLPEIKSLVDQVVAESLFNGWDNLTKKYFQVPEKSRENLLKELDAVKKMGVPVTVVDYLPPNKEDQAKVAAKRIADLGFNPWITDGALNQIYLFDFEPLPRKILLFYQGTPGNVDEKIGSYLSFAVSMPLNYMGYVTELRNIADPLPHNLSAKDYAGIVVAPGGNLLGRQMELTNWYKDLLKKKIPVVILNSFGFPPKDQNVKMFGLSVMETYNPMPANDVKIIYKAPIMGYEIAPVVTGDDFLSLRVLNGKSLLKAEDDMGNVFDVAAITPWGGYYLTNNILLQNIGDYFLWTIDPFKFFRQALKLPEWPTPDLTSENGNRLMMVHIDGDGFANRGEWYNAPYTGEILSKEFLKRYVIPTTVSIIQGEIASNGLHPQLSAQLEKIARKIFALPNVEIASHTYSHPFTWSKAEKYTGTKPNPYTIKIPNYKFNVYTEIVGSVEYINKNLSPPGKKCKVFLWSGEGDIPEKALEYTYQLGLANLNPGKLITKSKKSLTRVSALGLFEGGYFQVFAPIGNDNETISLNTRFYSLINIIPALKLTDHPRRLKPIDIYFHFYTLQRPAGIKALHEIYKWALSTPVMNIYVSDYFNKIQDFQSLMIAKMEDGWSFITGDSLREIRIPESMGYPDLIGSSNVIGYSSYNDDRYIHLGPGGQSFIRFSSQPPTLPYLVDSTARVTRFLRKKNQIDFTLEGYLPPKFTFANVSNCSLWDGKKIVSPKSQKEDQKRYEFTEGLRYELSVRCQ
ncbi:bifunctional glycoside hydrolase 114/ polysaccharide deacetylase family protein [Legionella sainthelensi]|uniref:bifunctional glycoside hydrolase 114/ polysaccharide deacetylase family protein n=1 Tax=Legionella sainthelensi TaxID=28087 RepID=UPI000E1FC876|nr:endo alpha-1,4 polygalactosaminidase [Legionella sainthelensi]